MRRISESMTEEETERRMNIAQKMVDVQKELLASHPPTKVCWLCMCWHYE